MFGGCRVNDLIWGTGRLYRSATATRCAYKHSRSIHNNLVPATAVSWCSAYVFAFHHGVVMGNERGSMGQTVNIDDLLEVILVQCMGCRLINPLPYVDSKNRSAASVAFLENNYVAPNMKRSIYGSTYTGSAALSYGAMPKTV